MGLQPVLTAEPRIKIVRAMRGLERAISATRAILLGLDGDIPEAGALFLKLKRAHALCELNQLCGLSRVPASTFEAFSDSFQDRFLRGFRLELVAGGRERVQAEAAER